ncbi:FAD synthetase family protein [Jeotgalibacillus soli]|uniref:FAD synthase n=1 Tax=Jeotgalibacillus soli TaxID=889306 RepID=A0A0C2VKZ6_9BACL|nr:FAD synthetase family protein [Jeotgalibacillus soli]KIL45121.1 riboflavin kinase [Jeotgalibacillus soli]
METVYLTHNQNQVFLDIEPCVMVLGFFDGVHIGHQCVIHTAKKIAEEKNVELAAITFFPHPKEILNHVEKPFRYITPMSDKEETLAGLGIDKLYVIEFNRELAALPPKSFIEHYVIGLNAVHVVAGFDFTYGNKGEGNMDTIGLDGNGRFQVTKVQKVTCGDQKISSTLIRETLGKGEVEKIPDYLGDFYETQGEILIDTIIQEKGKVRAYLTTKPGYTLPSIGWYSIEVFFLHQIFAGTSSVQLLDNGVVVNEIELEGFKPKDNNTLLKIKWLNRIDECENKNPVNKNRLREFSTSF